MGQIAIYKQEWQNVQEHVSKSDLDIFSGLNIFTANSSISLCRCNVESILETTPEPPDCLRMWSIRTTHPWWNTPSNATPTGYQRQTLDTWPIGPWKITENFTFSTWIHLHLGFSMVNIRTWNQRMTKFAPSVVTQVYRGHCGYHSPFCRSLLDFGIEFFRQTKLLVGSHISMVGPGRHTHLYSPVAAIPSGKLT